MQIVIPMSGFGERFRRAGYSVPKPLIEVDGKPIIEHVVEMFPGAEDVIFICNRDHLETPEYRMRETLERIAPRGQIVAIDPHKLGPIHAVEQVADLLDPSAPVIVNYCDFTCYWSFDDFRRFAHETGCQGALPAYKGFHPHSLGTTNYAYIRETDGWALDIQEKQPFTDNRMDEYASSGTYYFASAELMLEAFKETRQQGWDVGGEYYVSMAYKSLFQRELPVAVYELEHFMQWGTPGDLEEYLRWSATFRRLAADSDRSEAPVGTVILPMAGLGQRFTDEGYDTPKPLIEVSGKPMVMQALGDLPSATVHSVVLRSDMPGAGRVRDMLDGALSDVVITELGAVTDGQARTAVLGLRALQDRGVSVASPITVGACDSGLLYNAQKLRQLLDADAADLVVWTVRGHTAAVRRPAMFGWVDADPSGEVRGVSVKQPLADPSNDPVIVGTFTFASGEIMERCIQSLFDRDGRVNGEYYLDSCIEDAVALGYSCRIFDVDFLLPWGTPDELRTFTYWQGCFHKWKSHPYTVALDSRVDTADVARLERAFAPAIPPRPVGVPA